MYIIDQITCKSFVFRDLVNIHVRWDVIKSKFQIQLGNVFIGLCPWLGTWYLILCIYSPFLKKIHVLNISIYFSVYIYGYMVVWFSHSVGSSSLLPHVACQAPLSLGFLRQKYWSGLPFPSPGDLPNQGMGTHVSCIAGRVLLCRCILYCWATWEGNHLQCRRSVFNPWSGRSPGEGNGSPLSILAWRTPWTEEPGGLWLQSMGSQSQTQLSN